jgi:hypothetical protein
MYRCDSHNVAKFHAVWPPYEKIRTFLCKKSGSVAKNPKIEAKFQFHIKEYKKAEYFLDNIQI